jgi:hypothetical protein
MSKIRLLTGLYSSDPSEREFVPSLLLSFWWFLGYFWHSLACRIVLISSFVFTWCSPYMCVCDQIFLFMKISVIGVRASPNDLILV